MPEEAKAISSTNNQDKYVQNIPYRVQAALNYLGQMTARYCFGESSVKQVEFTREETVTQNKALSCLNRYFDGELDYGDRPPSANIENLEANEQARKTLKDIKQELEKLEKGIT